MSIQASGGIPPPTSSLSDAVSPPTPQLPNSPKPNANVLLTFSPPPSLLLSMDELHTPAVSTQSEKPAPRFFLIRWILQLIQWIKNLFTSDDTSPALTIKLASLPKGAQLPAPAPIGFTNYWNDCFLIALLQMLYHTSSFANYLRAVADLQPFFEAYKQRDPSFFNVKDLRACLPIPRDADGTISSQEDPVDFLEILLDKALSPNPLQSSPPLFSTTAQCFSPKTQQAGSVVCSPQIPEKNQSFISLLPAKSSGRHVLDFQTLLANYFVEQLEGVAYSSLTNSFFDSKDPAQYCTRKTRLHSAPQDLLFRVQRFFNSPQHCLLKMQEAIDTPLTITLKKEWFLEEASTDVSYECQAFLTHLGSGIGGGHYTAHIKILDCWYLCNDDAVTLQTQAQVEEAIKTCYMISYAKKAP